MNMAIDMTNETQPAIPKTQSEAQAQGITCFFASGVFSDLVITCQGQEWRVHKTQICAQSEFFYKACTTEFKEAGENKIKLDEDDPQVVEAMLHYLYHGTYGDAGNATTDLPSILLDVKVFVIADKYFVEPLKAVACRKFGEHCKDEWKTADFAQAVQELYESGVEDKSLKDVALAAVRIHAKDLLTKNGEFPDIHKAMRETPAFGADVLTDLTAASNAFSTDIDRPTATSETLREMYRWTFRCPNCLSTFSVDIPLGSSVEFGCPKGHSRDESFFFWKKYST